MDAKLLFKSLSNVDYIDMEKRLFKPADKIAPGLYMNYWASIVSKYGDDHLNINKLKQYREVRNGAILAAMWTKTTGRKHFVSFPQDEPSDVEIYSLLPTIYKDKPSYHLTKIPVQLTRCSSADGETVAGQVAKKNKASLAETSLVVHMLGEDNVKLDLNKIVDEVLRIGSLHPKEIVLLAPIEDKSTIEQTFAQLLIYHREEIQVRSSRVHTGDTEAFFTYPSVMQSQRGTGRALDADGEFNLLLP